MSYLDLLILLPVAYFSYRGFSNGLIKEVFSIVGIILGVFCTFQYMDAVSAFIRPYFYEDASAIPFISAILIFIGILATTSLLAYLLRKFLETVKLNFLNRFAGAGFGMLKSGIVISTLLLILAGFNLPSQQTREQSVSYPYVIYLAPWTYDMIATIYPGAENFVSTVEKTLENYNPVEHFPFIKQNKATRN